MRPGGEEAEDDAVAHTISSEVEEDEAADADLVTRLERMLQRCEGGGRVEARPKPLRRLDLVDRELRHRLSDLLGELAAAPFRSTATRNPARAQPSHEVK